MEHALRLGRRTLGATGANPAVGCVVVNNGVLVGAGWTAEGGSPHAETRALAMAGNAARGATAYVTLEPCSHHGSTPPCAGALIEAGLARVVTALEDPDPRVSGRGHAALRAAGIDRARGLVATTDSDGLNVYVILSARTLNPELFIVSRASTDAAIEKLNRAGADRVVSPYQMAGRRLAALALRPRVVDFLDAAIGGGVSFALEEVEVVEDGPLAGRSVGDLDEQQVRVLALVRDGREQELNPASDRVLKAGDVLIVVGPSERLDEIIR
jgi:pyrimidine deaminase RibD-like protein